MTLAPVSVPPLHLNSVSHGGGGSSASARRHAKPTSARVVAFQQLNNNKYSVLVGTMHRDWMNPALTKSLHPDYDAPLLTPAPPVDKANWTIRGDDADGNEDLQWLQRRQSEMHKERASTEKAASSPHLRARPPHTARTVIRPAAAQNLLIPKAPNTSRSLQSTQKSRYYTTLISPRGSPPQPLRRSASTQPAKRGSSRMRIAPKHPSLMDSERSIDDTLQYLHSDFFRLNTRADGTKRHRGNRVENLVKEANEGDVVEDLNAGGTMTLDEEGNTTALLLPSAFSGLNSYREAPSPAKVKEVKEHSKIVYNPNMIKPVKTISLPAESEQPGTPGLSRRASKFRNAGHQVIKGRTSFRSVVLALSNSQDPLKLAQKSTGLDLLRSAQKSTGWGSKSQKSTKMKDAMKEEKDVKGNEKAKEALKEETVTKVVSSSMKDDKGMSGRQGKQSEEDKTQVDDQQEKLSGEMGVFPNWLWERDDFQTIHNQPLTDTCLRILSNVPDERHELHLSKLKQWVAKKENGACIPFLSELPAQLLTGVLKVLKLQRISEGEVLHREGQTGEIFYMLFSGTMAATTKGPLGRMRSMKAGETFGHSSLSSSYQETIKHNRRSKSKKGGHELEADDRQQHRHETVQATTDCVLLTLGYYAYDSMQREHQKQQEKDELDFLKGLPTFAGWDKTRIHHLHSAMQPKVVDKGELLWRQGMPADSIALVLEGHVTELRTIEVTEAKRVAATNGKSLQTEEKRQAWQCKVRAAKTGSILGLEVFTGSTKRDYTIKVRSPTCRILILKVRHLGTGHFFPKDIAKLRSQVDIQRHRAAKEVSRLLTARYPVSHERYPIPATLWTHQGEEVRETHYSANAEVDLDDRTAFYGLEPGMVYVKFNPELRQVEPEYYDSSPEASLEPNVQMGDSLANERILKSSPPYKMPTPLSYHLEYEEEAEEASEEEEDSDEEGEVDEEHSLESDDDVVPVNLALMPVPVALMPRGSKRSSLDITSEASASSPAFSLTDI